MKKYQALIIILLIVALLPFCYVCLYALPYADDFCIGWELLQGKPLLTSIAEQYLYWNGRYTSNIFFNLDPVATGSLAVYSATVLGLLLLTPIVFYLLVIQLVKQRRAVIIVSLLISLLYLNYMPNVTEGIYWYIGSVNYHLGAMLCILQVALFIRLYRAEDTSIGVSIVSLVLLIAITGFNEVGAMLIPLFYLVLMIVGFKEQSVKRKLSAIHFVIAVIASAFVVFSPGNATRLGQFADKYNFFHSALYAALQTGRFTGIWILNYPFIVCSILTVLYAEKLKDSFVAKIDWRFAVAGAFGVVFTAAFIPYYATGILGQHRTMNYVYPFFILLWFAGLSGLSLRYQLPVPVFKTDRARMLLLLSAIVVMYVTGNSLKIIADVKDNRFEAYKTEYLNRQHGIIAGAGSIAPLMTIPYTFSITDAKADSTYWVDKCMKLYYTKAGDELR